MDTAKQSQEGSCPQHKQGCQGGCAAESAGASGGSKSNREKEMEGEGYSPIRINLLPRIRALLKA